MNEPFARSLYAVYSNPLPEREAALHAWYEDVHIPDSLGHGLLDSVRRYEAVGANGARFLTLWGCDYRDEQDALSAVRPVAEELRSKGRIEVVQEVVFQQFVFLEGVVRERGARNERWLTTLHSCWARPDAVPAFGNWLEGEYASLVLEAGTAARYGVTSPRAKALVLLEGDETLVAEAAGWSEHTEPGLPPFGKPTPIFSSGSPAPSPVPEAPPSDSQIATWHPAWVAHWQLISAR